MGHRERGTRQRVHTPRAAPPGRARAVVVDETSEIIDYFLACTNKQQVLQGILDFASRYFGCVAVYVIRGQVIEKVDAICDLDGPLSTPNGRLTIFKRCITSGRPYYGAIPVMELNDPRLSTLVSLMPERCWVYPMAVSDHIDCLLHAELPKTSAAHCTERFEFLVGKAVLALRRLLIEQLMLK